MFFLPRVSRFAPSSPVEALQWVTGRSVQLSHSWLSPELVRQSLTTKNRIGEQAPRTYCQETVVLKVKGGNQAMTYLFIPALFSLAVISYVWIRDAVEGN